MIQKFETGFATVLAHDIALLVFEKKKLLR